MFQCHGSTGHCWCVDNRGQERAGTRTPPGTAPADCDKQGDRYKNTSETPRKTGAAAHLRLYISHQLCQNVLKLSVNTTETAYRRAAQRDFQSLDHMFHSVMMLANTYICRFEIKSKNNTSDDYSLILTVNVHISSCSVMARLDTVGVWTVMVRNGLEQKHRRVQHPPTVTIQVRNKLQIVYTFTI